LPPKSASHRTFKVIPYLICPGSFVAQNRDPCTT
jgi:hypothetical protein